GTPGSLPWTEVGNRELEVVVSKPRVYGSVDTAPKPMMIGVSSMTAPTSAQAPTPPGPVAPAPVIPAAPAANTTQAPAAPAATAESAQDAPQERRGRGRGRPADVVERDEKVLSAVTAEGITREKIAEVTGLDPTRVYQSLWRLRRDGKVERTRDGRTHAWKLKEAQSASACSSRPPARAPVSRPGRVLYLGPLSHSLTGFQQWALVDTCIPSVDLSDEECA